jgi:hypothetical protein
MKKIGLLMMGLLLFAQAEFERTNSMVIDTETKLQWTDNNDSNSYSITWNQAITYCNELSYYGGGWRVPNINELKSLIEDTVSSPSLSSKFIFVKPTSYWSSTIYSSQLQYRWGVDFNTGNIQTIFESYIQKHDTLCVREKL